MGFVFIVLKLLAKTQSLKDFTHTLQREKGPTLIPTSKLFFLKQIGQVVLRKLVRGK